MKKIAPFLAGLLLWAGCNSSETNPIPQDQPPVADSPLFRLLPKEESGVDFVNQLQESQMGNYFLYLYFYNGGGVCIGDIDNDGLSDIYLTGNMVPNKLYHNLGSLKFEDITASAGLIGSPKWTTGATMADVNGDGLLDIYICQSGLYDDPEYSRPNLLYINNGDRTFTEMGVQYAVNDPSASTHATFFDYDLDGDLDLYVVNHPLEFGAKIDYKLQKAANPGPYDSDRLYRNDGEKFTNVTKEAGILNYGFGLSATVGDVNNDGYPDIFVANDFAESDFLYINQKNGTFKNQIREMTYHISQFGMGSDIADINNDGLMDIMELDMMAEENKRKKTLMQGMNPEAFAFNVKAGYHYQYMQNCLQLNNGNGTFSEIAELAGVSTTDWSWAPLLADFDNDGWKDLFVTNGYRRDARDNDFMKKIENLGVDQALAQFESTLQLMPVNKIPNYAFKSLGNLKFEKVSKEWGLDFMGFSNGTAYGDLDNDGDLDLVVNNLDDRSLVYENTANQKGNHWLRVKLKGKGKNTMGMGAKVTLVSTAGTQTLEQTLSRGFQSSVDPVLHFGLGNEAQFKEMVVDWPDGTRQIVPGGSADREVVIEQNGQPYTRPALGAALVADVTAGSGLNFGHKESAYDDYKAELLLPHRQSVNGPKLAVADVTGDGLDDVFVGGAAGQAGQIFVQTSPNKFRAGQSFTQDAACEDLGAIFFDANGDGQLDLYVASGTNEFAENDPRYQDRLYINKGGGSGNFAKAADLLPNMPTPSASVAAGDFDGDGDMDLFVGGKGQPQRYPYPGKSYLLINDGGKFSDQTEKWLPGLSQMGMVNTCATGDWNGDGKADLMVGGEWMPVRVFVSGAAKFEELPNAAPLGWWFSLTPADLDGDGDLDMVAGNLGENTKYKAADGAPFEVYAGDFDGSSTLDIVLAYANAGKMYPVRGRTCSSQQMPFLKEKFPTYAQFGESTMDQIYGEKLKDALHYAATWMKSSVLINDGKGNFACTALPVEAQFSATMGAVVVPGKGDQRLFLAGNLYDAEVETERHDASIGVMLNGGETHWQAVPVLKSGFFAPGNVRDLKLIRTNKGSMALIVARNNGPLSLYAISE